MGKGFKSGVSTGAPLNFKVVGGTTAPANPKENTIWVNTDTDINGYIFSGEDPNLLNVAGWALNVTVTNGTKTLTGDSISITSTGEHCITDYTNPHSTIQCEAGKTYVVQWDYDGDYDSFVVLYPNGSSGGAQKGAKLGRLEYTVPDGVTYFCFSITVGTNKTATFTNIRITEKELAFDIGTVWIYTGTSTPAKFNALKKNQIIVNPIAAMQCYSGIWQFKFAQIYKNSKWTNWAQWLYSHGALFDGMELVKSYTYGSPTVTYNASSINVRCHSNNDTQYLYFPVSANLDGRSKMVMKFKSNAAYTSGHSEDWGAGVRFGVSTSTDHTSLAAQAKQYNLAVNTEYTIEFDVSNLSGYYYVHLMFARGDSASSGSVDVDVLEVYAI